MGVLKADVKCNGEGRENKNIVNIVCQSLDEWLNILAKNSSKEIVNSDDPRKFMLGFNFVENGKIKNYYVYLVEFNSDASIGLSNYDKYEILINHFNLSCKRNPSFRRGSSL